MTSGSIGQAKCRSASNKTAGDDRNAFQHETAEPNRNELLMEIARKCTLGLKLDKKLTQVIVPVIINRNILIDTAKKLPNGSVIAAKRSESIPSAIPKSLTGKETTTTILEIHAAMASLVESGQRPSRTVLKSYKKVDLE
jgi:hypothetical protein